MEIHLKDLDPRIADLVAGHWSALAEGERRFPAPATGRAERDGFVTGLGIGVAIPAGLILSGVLGASLHNELIGLVAALGSMGTVAAWVRHKFKRYPGDRVRAGWRKDRAVAPEDLRVVAKEDALSRTEAAYCNVLALLAARLGDDGGFGPEARQDLLEQLAALAERGRELERQERQIQGTLKTDAVTALEKEREALLRRRESAKDAIAREAVEQSLAMNEQRLANARVFEEVGERLAAQQEALAQALASIQSSLVRSSLTPADTVSAASGIEEVRATVTQINSQTQSVEQAVAEVMALRSG